MTDFAGRCLICLSMIRQYPQILGLKSDPFNLRPKPSEYLSEISRGVLLRGLGECIRRGNSASIVIAKIMIQLQPDVFHVCFLSERQMRGILYRTLNLAGVRSFEFEPFTTEDLSDYVQKKLVMATCQYLPPSSPKSMFRPAASPMP